MTWPLTTSSSTNTRRKSSRAWTSPEASVRPSLVVIVTSAQRPSTPIQQRTIDLIERLIGPARVLLVVLLVSVVLIVSALTFFPALSLGPIVEHLLMGGGKLF